MENNVLINKVKKVSSKKQNIKSIVFSRACCSIGIVIFHYFEHARGNYRFYFRTANSDIGTILVTTFFGISGTTLFYNYPKIYSIKTFYYKRWKSILISYYISNIYFYLSISLISQRLIFKGPLKKLIFNFFGLDGYLLWSYGISAFNLVGEWFLGAIIIIYFLYPLISYLMNKNILIINFITSINYYLMYKTNIYEIVIHERNIITCLNSFYFGMLIIQFKTLFFKSKMIFLFSVSIFIFLSLVKINTSFVLIKQIQGFSFYIILLQLGEYIMSKSYIKLIYIFNALSYSIFLYHHRIIIDALKITNPNQLHLHIIFLINIIILITICAKIHSSCVNYILNTKIFGILDSLFLKQ